MSIDLTFYSLLRGAKVNGVEDGSMINQSQCLLISDNKINNMFEWGVVAHTCNPSSWEVKAGESGLQG